MFRALGRRVFGGLGVDSLDGGTGRNHLFQF